MAEKQQKTVSQHDVLPSDCNHRQVTCSHGNHNNRQNVTHKWPQPLHEWYYCQPMCPVISWMCRNNSAWNNSCRCTLYSSYGGSQLGIQCTKHLLEMLTMLDTGQQLTYVTPAAC